MADPNCIFCKIVAGDIPSEKIYEDEHVFAFMDISPLSQGHCLIIPKEHAVTLHETSNEVLSKVLPVASRIVKAMGISTYNLLQNNGEIAHQAVMHAHFHIIPRRNTGEGLGISWQTKEGVDQKTIADAIRSKF
ncbi:MAG: HIT family protein [Candidatus Kariarchaeaceae archaeon]|jgi:diadenosine tetraphosphate (Ap4A) HIT family hydrolase